MLSYSYEVSADFNTTICTIRWRGRVFHGKAQRHPDDISCSHTGKTVAKLRAEIQWYSAMISEAKHLKDTFEIGRNQSKELIRVTQIVEDEPEINPFALSNCTNRILSNALEELSYALKKMYKQKAVREKELKIILSTIEF